MALSSNKLMQYCNSHVINPREIVAWVLVGILVVLLIVVITGLLAVWIYLYRRRNKPNDASPNCALAMDSNPCYEASNLKQTEAEEPRHVYEAVNECN